jgi:hypothetical protein
LADRRSLLAISLVVLVTLGIVATIVVLGSATPSPSPTASGSPAPSLPVTATLPPNDQPAMTMRDFEFKTEAITSVSASPAQSKLWYAQDAWWAGLYTPDADDIHIFRLDWATQIWLDTGTVVDERGDADSDFLWTGEHLYVASGDQGHGLRTGRGSSASASTRRRAGTSATPTPGRDQRHRRERHRHRPTARGGPATL